MIINNNIKMLGIIIIGIIILSLFRVKYSDYNLNRTISACLMAQKKTSELFDPKKARKFCEEEIQKKIEGSK